MDINFPKNLDLSKNEDYIMRVLKTGEELEIKDNRGFTNKISNFLNKYIYSGKWSYKTSNINAYIFSKDLGENSQKLKIWLFKRLENEKKSYFITHIYDSSIKDIDKKNLDIHLSNIFKSTDHLHPLDHQHKNSISSKSDDPSKSDH
ncbi:MAG: hypothetical protein H0X29_02520 [Parachlamydiaceae bacterium]|nr:hypothetical protein [Parachlamydiaceae bacterium]